jgi:hypothetical protein
MAGKRPAFEHKKSTRQPRPLHRQVVQPTAASCYPDLPIPGLTTVVQLTASPDALCLSSGK